jgi:hypothetical protein
MFNLNVPHTQHMPDRHPKRDQIYSTLLEFGLSLTLLKKLAKKVENCSEYSYFGHIYVQGISS